MKLFSASILAAALLAGCGGSDDGSAPVILERPTQTVDGVLVGPNGMSLYVFDKDTVGSGKSACNGQCAVAWPPLAAAADAQNPISYSVITRDDGTRQWTYNGAPLYYWYKDTKPGDRTGDGVGGVWHLARP